MHIYLSIFKIYRTEYTNEFILIEFLFAFYIFYIIFLTIPNIIDSLADLFSIIKVSRLNFFSCSNTSSLNSKYNHLGFIFVYSFFKKIFTTIIVQRVCIYIILTFEDTR